MCLVARIVLELPSWALWCSSFGVTLPASSVQPFLHPALNSQSLWCLNSYGSWCTKHRSGLCSISSISPHLISSTVNPAVLPNTGFPTSPDPNYYKIVFTSSPITVRLSKSRAFCFPSYLLYLIEVECPAYYGSKILCLWTHKLLQAIFLHQYSGDNNNVFWWAFINIQQGNDNKKHIIVPGTK